MKKVLLLLLIFFLLIPTSKAHAEPYSISGNVYEDSNNNGVQDVGELNYPDATITLTPFGGITQYVITDELGNYAFTNLMPGLYSLVLTVPTGYVGTTTGATDFNLTANDTMNFGIQLDPNFPVLFQDDFTSINGTSILTHNNGAWSASVNINDQLNSPSNATIQDNAVLAGNNGANDQLTPPVSIIAKDACVSTDILFPFTENTAHELQLREIGTGSDPETGLLAFINPDHNAGFTWWSSEGKDSWNQGISNGIWPDSGWHTFKFCAIGNRLTSYLDNHVLASGNDSHVNGAGHSAFEVRGETRPSIDNFVFQGIAINQAPNINTVTLSPNPVQINTSVIATANFSDNEISQTHTASANWGDGINTSTTCSITEPNNSTPGYISCPFSGYIDVNVYPVTITVSDGEDQATSSVTYISVYNPTQSSIFTAGSSYDNPESAYPSNSGKIKFGLSYKYQGGVATGNKAFTMDFNEENIHFNATSVSSLVILNGKAILQGAGDLNENSGYSFIVTGMDSKKIRIQLKDLSNNVIYDSQPNASINENPITSVNGNVVIN